MEELQKGLHKDQKAEREMERAESQLHIQDNNTGQRTEDMFFWPQLHKDPIQYK